MHEVIICEKPTSSEKIAHALSNTAEKKTYNKKITYWEIEEGDKKITILSAAGHLYSLKPINPREKDLFDLKWVPIYETDSSKKYIKDYVNAIKKFSKKADRYIHACDYDIEGTLIGYNTLKYACGVKSLDHVSRMKFSTLTKEELVNAYENAIELDMDQVDGGIARHTMDFIFGVNISKYLMDSVRKASSRFIKLSAGRVQTPTLAILTEREHEIRDFIPEPYWRLEALLENSIVAKHTKGDIYDKEVADKAYSNCLGSDALVSDLKTRKGSRKSPVPFDLGGLQSEAYRIFKYTPKRTQQIAQSLYTGGYTSYPRTSSQKLPASLNFEKIMKQLSANPIFKEHIEDLPEKLKPNEGKKEDAAHPAIHPTGVLPKSLRKDESNIYKLIVHRFISVFAPVAKTETMNVKLDIGGEEFKFSRKRTLEMGWLKHYPWVRPDNDEFPEMGKGEIVPVKKIKKEEKETEPPKRYNEGSIVKELEKRNLGTKSTRGEIISTLSNRKYVNVVDGKIEVKALGDNMIQTLGKYCEDIISEELTRKFEKELSEIETSTISKDKVLADAKKEVESILKNIEDNSKNIGDKLFEAYQNSMIVGKCPECDGNLVKKYSPRNKSYFVGCSEYPNCEVAYSLPYNANVLKTKCEKCGLPMISFGKPRQRACLNPKCGTSNKGKIEPEVVGKCPDCGKDLLKRSGRYGEFIGCSGFPKCRFTSSVDEFFAEKKEE